MKRPFVFCGLLMTATLAGACYESPAPLDSAPPALDARLLGPWRCVNPDLTDDAFTIRVAAANRMYAITWEESGKPPDHYEGFLTPLSGTTLMNLRESPPKPDSQWSLMHLTFFQPTIVMVRVVEDKLLKGLDVATVRKTLERQRDNPQLYQNDYPLVCIKAK
jgi:hypothetical protein